MKKLTVVMGILASIAFSTGCSTNQKRIADSSDIISNSVSITNNESNSGGSGTVLRSSDAASYVLTNSHVCEVAEEGGLVHGEAGTFAVAGLKHSKQHDLCLIKVYGNLRASAKLASSGPADKRASATISGHPSLYPTVVTKGHFSGRETIQVMTGFEECTEETIEKGGLDAALMCLFFGGIPVVKNYDSVLVSATIMPGSSGSGVFNKDNELTGVVFAGSGELGYAWTVPYEYVREFVNVESKSLKFKTPSNKIDLFGKRGERRRKIEAAKASCKSPATALKAKKTCKMLDQDMVF